MPELIIRNMITSSEVLNSEREWLQRCFQTIDSKNTCPQFGYLRGDNFADRNVPAGEIKIDCWGRFEKKRSREVNEIKGFEIGKKTASGLKKNGKKGRTGPAG